MTDVSGMGQKRHKCYEDSHRDMIEIAVGLISKKGLESLSMAGVARAMGVNRTTVYYHFNSREMLIEAVKCWSSAQLSKAFEIAGPQHERIDYINRFVLENPELIKLWIEDLVSPGDIRNSYPHWDAFVRGTAESFKRGNSGETIDAEVFCVMLLTTSIIGVRVFKNSVCPDADNDTVIARFRGENQRMLKAANLFIM